MRFLFYTFLMCLFYSPAFAFDTYADIVENLMPSVVNISTEKEVIEDTEENVSNMMVVEDLKGRESLGSGFFIRDDGHILTNAHVVRQAKKITVTTNDNESYEAKIIGIDKPSDLAILKIEPKEKKTFKSVIFGNDEDSRIGDIVLTFGNPYGLGISVSQGIISAKSRSIGLAEQHYIQTDASINQGNSGGPMFNIDGEVIGVNTALFTVKGASGVGFALPSQIANWISNQLIATGKVKRGWIGMKVAYGFDKYTDKSGFVVTEINEESSAYKEGVRVGDIILSYNDTIAGDLSDFIKFTETLDVGQALRLKTSSYGEVIRHVVRIQEMPAEELKDATNKALTETQKFRNEKDDSDTVYISELKIAVREFSPRGLEILKMERKSPLSGKGIKIGDVILEADRSDIYSADNLLDSIRDAIVDDYRSISLLIQGIDNSFYSTIELEPEND